MLYAIVICVVERSVYMGSKKHIYELHRLNTHTHNASLKSFKMCTSQVVKKLPDFLETVCPTRWLTRLSVVIWNKVPIDVLYCVMSSLPHAKR